MDAEEDNVPEDPKQLFDAGRVLSSNGPHGVVVRAAVCEPLEARIDASSVAVKIVAVGERAAEALDARVRGLMSSVSHASLARYHGVWVAPRGEAWIVSDLYELGSVADVLAQAKIMDVAVLEKIAAYVMRNLLLALDSLHAMGEVHGDVKPNNILVDDRGRVKLGDWGIFQILETAMRLRVSYPGARLWPAPEIGRSGAGGDEIRGYDAVAEVWAVGIALVEMLEGRPSVLRSYNQTMRMRGSAEVFPGMCDPTRWSRQLNAFVAAACTTSALSRPSVGDLLKSDFLKLADGSALAAVVEEVSMLPTPQRFQELYDGGDVVQMLHRRNNSVRGALIDLDTVEADELVDLEVVARGLGDDKPAVEVSLRTALRNRGWAGGVGQAGMGDTGVGDARGNLRRSDALAVFIDTVDMAERRNG